MKKITSANKAYRLEGCSVYREKADGSTWRLGRYCHGYYEAKNEATDELSELTPYDLIGDYIVTERELWVADRESGNLIERVYSIGEGIDLIYEYEEQDKEDGVYVEDFYEVRMIER